MPSPQPDDPLRCPASSTTSFSPGGLNDWEARDAHDERWWICPACKRALKRLAGPHRVRSRTTASLDKTRDILANITQAEIASATATDPTRSKP